LKIDFKTCSEEELWKYISLNLSKNDVDVILVGGAVVSIYSGHLHHRINQDRPYFDE
jgi:Asp/Glu/hydantoin racemase